MTPKTREDFELESGGFLNAVDGAIAEAVFEEASGDYVDAMIAGDPNAKPGVMLRLTINVPDVDKPVSQAWSVGGAEQWEIAADGKSVTNIKSADKHMFRKGSRAGALVEAMMTAVGGGVLGKGQDFFINRNCYMTEAKFFEGLNFYWETKSLPTAAKGGTPRDVPLPVKFLGEVKGGAAAPAGAQAVDTTVLDAMVMANASGKTQQQVKTWAVKDPDIKANKEYMTSVVNGKKLTELENGGQLTLGADGKYA